MSTQLVPWKNVGKSGLKISSVAIGTMSFASKGWSTWAVHDEEEAFRILKEAYDHGIRTYDMSDACSNGFSEILIGKFLKKYNIKRDKVVIMTKVFWPIDEDLGRDFLFYRDMKTEEDRIDFINSRGLSRKHILDAAEGSVRRLGTYIDIYQVQRYDHDTPPEETMRAMNDVVEKGLARYIGCSSMRAVEFVELQHIADKNGWHKFISVQSFYNLLQREDEHEVNYYAHKHGIGIIPWSPLCRGNLARPVPKDDSELTERSRLSGVGSSRVSIDDPAQAADREIINRVGEIAEKRNVARASVAIAWVIAKGGTPIAGVNSVERVKDLVVGANLKLDQSEMNYLEEPYKPKLRQGIL